MASISRETNGRKTIQFVAGDGKRRSIRLGKATRRSADTVKLRVEQLNAASISGCAWDDDLARWVASLPDGLMDKLARVGLIARRETGKLKAFLQGYIDSRTDVKPLTHKKYLTTFRDLVEFFGAERDLRDISPGDADEWRLSRLKLGNAENTIRKHVAVAKLFFSAAVRKRLIPANPFEDMKATIQPNFSRFYFVTIGEAEKVLKACPDTQWRLLFALSRFGGLRCPSEHLALRWGDVNWADERITVRSPKTEHHVGGESRVIPMFPELRPYLEAAFEQADVGTEYLVTRYRDSNTNLRTQLMRIIDRAGLNPWPKLFQNLRSTRQTELEEIFPSHVVCAWLGNSQSVARKHYLQVTDEHFDKAVQNPVQQTHAEGRTASQVSGLDSQNAEKCETVLNCTNVQVAEGGLEPP